MTPPFTSVDETPLAYQALAGRGPCLVWLSGFKSDMAGTKAQAVKAWAKDQGRAFLAFDYFGHGASGGDFAQGTIGRWRADALAAIDQLTDGPLVLIGSSMGGWIASLVADARPDRVAGLVLIAPALDFTATLMWPRPSPQARAEIERTGRWLRPSAYGDGDYVITQALIEEGASWSVLERGLVFSGPVRILQGQEDPDVPWTHALKTAEAFASSDVRVTLFKRGEHRLSRPDEIAALISAIDETCNAAEADKPA